MIPRARQAYDERLANTPLLALDIEYVLEQCQPPGSLVDLGCGTGRLAIALAQNGYRPTGVDLSPEMLRVLRAKAADIGIDIPLIQANLVELEALDDEAFDHAACLFSTLGLIEGEDNRRRFLRHVHRILRPGGTFVVHAHNRWFHLWTRAGRRLLWHNQGRGDFLMPAHEGIGPMTMHLFTRREMVRALQAAGFKVRAVRPVSLRSDGEMGVSWLLGGWRAFGFLVAAEKQ